MLTFGDIINEAINEQVIALHEALKRSPFPGFIESVPAYSSLAVFFDPRIIYSTYPQYQVAGNYVRQFLQDMLQTERDHIADSIRTGHLIPVWYSGEDLAELESLLKLNKEDIITLHTSRNYRVYMNGFLPGFAYMGILDKPIHSPRRQTPRTIIKAGSVGLAGMQTGIYPTPSPGGWQIIGYTPIKIFNPSLADPCLLMPGDQVKFYSITESEFNRLNEY